MPAIRTPLRSTKADTVNGRNIHKSLAITASVVQQETQDLADCKRTSQSIPVIHVIQQAFTGTVEYPLNEHERKAFKTRDGKASKPEPTHLT